MHGKARWSRTLPPGESGTLRVLFDPGLHNHAGEDTVVQGVAIVSDDPRLPEQVAKVAARVR